jgi:hypothetical protein
MFQAFNLVLSLVIALVLGTLSAAIMLDQWPHLSGERLGAWRVAVRFGDPAADPYTAALQQTRLTLPQSVVESTQFLAIADSDGEPLNGQCSYSIKGGLLPARLFTLRAESVSGSALPGEPGLPLAMHSNDMLFDGQGFTVTASRQAAPGNWLALRANGRFRLVLTAYDASIADETFGTTVALPAITRLGCADA